MSDDEPRGATEDEQTRRLAELWRSGNVGETRRLAETILIGDPADPLAREYLRRCSRPREIAELAYKTSLRLVPVVIVFGFFAAVRHQLGFEIPVEVNGEEIDLSIAGTFGGGATFAFMETLKAGRTS